MKFDWERIKRYEARAVTRKQLRDSAAKRNEEWSAELARNLIRETIAEIQKSRWFSDVFALRQGRVVVDVAASTITGCDGLLDDHKAQILEAVGLALRKLRNNARYA